MKKNKFDWLGFFINAYFGIIIGILSGYVVFVAAEFFFEVKAFWFCFCGGVLYGVVAGIQKDDFWDRLRM